MVYDTVMPALDTMSRSGSVRTPYLLGCKEVTASIACYHKSMFGLNYPNQIGGEAVTNVGTWKLMPRYDAELEYQCPGRPSSKDSQPAAGKMVRSWVPLVPSGGGRVYGVAQWRNIHWLVSSAPVGTIQAHWVAGCELSCNRAFTTMRDPRRTDTLPTYACTVS